MIPQTVGALLAFLTLVAPGIFFDILRRRSRVGADESAFREISRTALSSLLLTLGAISCLAIARIFSAQYVIDPQRWIDGGDKYLRDNYVLVVFNFVFVLVVAFALAWSSDLVLRKAGKGKGALRWYSLWYEAFREHRPNGATPWVHVKMLDGSSFYGLLKSYTETGNLDEREIAVEGVGLTFVEPRGDAGEVVAKDIGELWETVLIPGREIRYIRVQYLNKETGLRVDSARRLAAVARDGDPNAAPNGGAEAVTAG